MAKTKKEKDYALAVSAYARAMNYLTSGNEEAARKQLLKMKQAWQPYGISVDVGQSLVKMKAEIARLSNQGLIDAPTSSTKSELASNPYVDNEYRSQQVNQKTVNAPQPPSSTPSTGNQSFNFDKQSKLSGNGVLSLSDFTDSEIYNSATTITPDVVEGGKFTLGYNNVKYGGYAPNLKVDFSSKLGGMHNASPRVAALNDYLSSQSIDINNIENLTPVELTKKIAESIKNSNLTLEQQEAKMENVTKRMTQILLNETDLSNDYLLSSEQTIRGRNYGNVGVAGGVVNSLFANVALNDKSQIQDTVSTNTLVKVGTADCRATNATFASLLNVGYQELGSPKEAKVLYTKMAHGTTAASFEKCNPEDHNVVLVQERDGSVAVRDAYFEHVDGTPLRTAINGHAAEGNLSPDENEVGANREWGFQIPGAPPYPPQQKLMTAEQRLQAEAPKNTATNTSTTASFKERLNAVKEDDKEKALDIEAENESTLQQAMKGG